MNRTINVPHCETVNIIEEHEVIEEMYFPTVHKIIYDLLITPYLLV